MRPYFKWRGSWRIRAFWYSLIDTKPFKEIHLGDLYTEKEKEKFLGYNELSREIFINNFLNDKNCKGDIRDQALAIEILYACSKGIHNHYNNIKKVENIEVRNDYTYRFIAKRLKEYSTPHNLDSEKKIITNSIYYKDIYTLYNIMNYINDTNIYEVFISIDDTRNVAGSLLYRCFKNKLFAFIYYKYIEYIINHKGIICIEKLVERNN